MEVSEVYRRQTDKPRSGSRLLRVSVVVMLVLSSSPALGKGGGARAHRSPTSSAAGVAGPRGTSSGRSNPSRCSSCPRDAHGRIERSEAARREFERQTGYPNGRPGYVVDHIIPLAKGGCDCPSNMQWQTKADAKAKDRVERK